MHVNRTLIAAAVAGLVATGSIACAQAAKAHGDPKLLAEAKVTPDAAQKIALKVQPGKIKDWELEREAGGSGLRYSIDIAAGGKTHEVGVDAADGKILENIVESAADEAKEEKGEKDHK